MKQKAERWHACLAEQRCRGRLGNFARMSMSPVSRKVIRCKDALRDHELLPRADRVARLWRGCLPTPTISSSRPSLSPAMDLLRSTICSVFIIPKSSCTDIQVLTIVVVAAIPLYFCRKALNAYFDGPLEVRRHSMHILLGRKLLESQGRRIVEPALVARRSLRELGRSGHTRPSSISLSSCSNPKSRRRWILTRPIADLGSTP